MPINGGSSPGGRFNWVKWVIWLPWVGIIVFLAVSACGYHAVDPLHMLDRGLTVERPYWYVVYYFILALFLGLALVFGRGAACHSICWMATFMILGRRIRNVLRWPALRLAADPESCTDCGACTREYAISLDVHGMMRAGDMEDHECILCGQCVDGCPRGTIRFSFSRG